VVSAENDQAGLARVSAHHQMTEATHFGDAQVLEFPELTAPDDPAFAPGPQADGEGIAGAPNRSPWPPVLPAWRTPDTLLTLALLFLATAMRLFAIRTAFDLNDDEVYYTDLGVSLRHGFFPPRFENSPFVLHPPLYFALSALWEDLFRPGPTFLDLVLRTRQLNVVCAGITAGLIFYLGSRLAGRATGLVAGLLFCFDPFIQQINGRALLETSTWMFALAGWCLLIRLFRPGTRHPRLLAVIGGLAAGLSLVDKDIAIAVVVPPLLVAMWRRWADRRTLGIAVVAAMVPTVIYVVALTMAGSFNIWLSQETSGLQRFLGLKKITGFSEGGHPSLISTLIRQSGLYGLSYLICGLGVLAAIYLLRRDDRPEIRVLATITLAGALTLVYATLFGTIETQMFYFPAVPAFLSLPIAVKVLLDRAQGTPLRVKARRILKSVAIGAFAVVLVGEGAVWLDIRTSPDNGMARVVAWFQTHTSSPGVIANDTDVTQLILSRSGYDAVDAGTPRQALDAGVRYVTILSATVDGHYGTLTPAEAAWYEGHGTLAFRVNERSYGLISIYRSDDPSQW
jgi:hypothetical protein